MNPPGARRWWALIALAIGLLAVGLDLTILNVALPTLATDLRASTSQLQWFNNAYNLALAAMLLPAGLLGDRFGRKRLLLAALTLFGVASVGCAFATSAGTLIAWRAALGLAAAFLMPLSLSMLTVLFSTQERPRAFSVWTTANFIGIPLGPVLGGWLLDHYWWGSVFLINVPVVAVALLALAVLLPESHSLRHPRLDLLGVVTSALGLVGLVYGLTRAGEQGWGDPGALTTMLAGVALLVGFVGWQRRLGRRPGGQPLVDLSLFGSASFTWAMLLFMLVMFALFGMMFTLPQYLQAVLGADALGTGLRLLPTIGGLMVGTQVAERLGRRVGAKATVALGFAVLTAGLLVGATTGVHTGYGTVASWMSAVGAGVGLVLPTAIGAALGALDAERSGVGSALVGVLRQVGGAFGVAIVGTVLSAAYHSRLDLTGLPTQAADAVRDSAAAGIAVAHQLGSAPLLDSVRAAFVHGMDATLWVCGGIAVAGAVLALAFLPRQPSATATADTNGDTARSGRDVAV